jgi:hypothetical protein
MTESDLALMRAESIRWITSHGFPVNPNLPWLDAPGVVKGRDEVVDRLFALFCIVGCRYGFKKDRAMAWLRQETKTLILTQEEMAFFESDVSTEFEVDVDGQTESMWALAWAVGAVPKFSFLDPCDDGFVSILPDIKRGASGAPFRRKAQLRPENEIVANCDLGYCLHWALVNASLSGGSLKMDRHNVVERRRALEWILSSESWEEISLDT